MAESIKLEVVTPEKYVVSEDARIIVAPGELGEFGVLPGHTPFLTSLQIGRLRYRDLKDEEHYIFIGGGFAETQPGRVTILAESAERSDDIDVERAEAALKRAEERLSSYEPGVDIARAKAAIMRARTRLRVAGVSEPD